jgi:septum formation topological specificity factor MinE
MAKIRAEIFAVVSKYLVIDESAINFDLLTDEKMTMLTATMPVIRSPEARRTVSSIASPPLVID